MVSRRIVEVMEVDLAKANELLKDKNWALYKVYGNDSTLEIKYVMVRYEADTRFKGANI